MPAEEGVGGFIPTISDEQEHLIPEDEPGHDARSTCACEPLRASNVRGGANLPTWYHRSLHRSPA